MSCLPIVFVLALSAGPEPFSPAAQKELTALEGDWVVQRIETGGKKIDPGARERFILTIKGKSWDFPTTMERGEITALDPSTNPKLIDLKSMPKGREAFVREAIYKVEKDILTMCIYQGKDKNRPTTFDPPNDESTILFVLKRSKP